MLIDMLEAVISPLLFALPFVSVYATLQKMRAVPGTRVKYTMSTLAFGTEAALVVLFLVGGILNLAKGDYVGAGLRALCMLIWLWLALRSFEDDNWFNDQWKRLKRGLKSLRRRLTTVRLPRPVPSPT